MRRRHWQSAIIISFIALVISPPGHAICSAKYESCEPSIDDVRVKIERLLNSAWLTPYSIVSLERFDGRSIEVEGHEKYEMRIFGVLKYFGDKLLCRTKFCPELHNYLVEVDEATKKATIAGWLFFDHADQRWR
jgi:hypothetical protein